MSQEFITLLQSHLMYPSEEVVLIVALLLYLFMQYIRTGNKLEISTHVTLVLAALLVVTALGGTLALKLYWPNELFVPRIINYPLHYLVADTIHTGAQPTVTLWQLLRLINWYALVLNFLCYTGILYLLSTIIQLPRQARWLMHRARVAAPQPTNSQQPVKQ